MRSQEGSPTNYNMQNVVDEKHGLIVSNDVVTNKNDKKQFANQINKANRIHGKNCRIACGDAGYARLLKVNTK